MTFIAEASQASWLVLEAEEIKFTIKATRGQSRNGLEMSQENEVRGNRCARKNKTSKYVLLQAAGSREQQQAAAGLLRRFGVLLVSADLVLGSEGLVLFLSTCKTKREFSAPALSRHPHTHSHTRREKKMDGQSTS